MRGPAAFVRACLACLPLLIAACGELPRPSATDGGVPTAPAATSTPALQPTDPGAVSPAAQPTGTPDSTIDPGQTGGTSPTPDVGLLTGIRWAHVTAASEFMPGDAISDAVSLDAMLVAVGTSATDGAAVWTSRDGLAWHRSADLPNAADSTMDDVTVGPTGLVVVGSATTGRGLVPAVWVSADGLIWEAVDDPDLAAGEMAAVAAGPDGYVALGTDIATGDANVVWISADARDWSGQQMAEAFGPQPSVSDVIRLADTYLAFGARDEQAALWVSPGGVTWETAPDFPIAPGGVVTAAASTSRTVAVGANYAAARPQAFAWSSTDGLSWVSATIGPETAAGEMLAVLPVGDGFIAVGEEGGGERGGLAAVWTTLDGTAWQRQPHDPSFALGRMSVVLHAGTGLVVLGEAAIDASGEEFAPAVWVGVAG